MTVKPIEAASPQLLKVLYRQNVEALRGLRMLPAADERSRMHAVDLREQTERLSARLEWWDSNPPAPRLRRTWRDIKRETAAPPPEKTSV